MVDVNTVCRVRTTNEQRENKQTEYSWGIIHPRRHEMHQNSIEPVQPKPN
jgi:hypothetical protein